MEPGPDRIDRFVKMLQREQTPINITIVGAGPSARPFLLVPKSSPRRMTLSPTRHCEERHYRPPVIARSGIIATKQTRFTRDPTFHLGRVALPRDRKPPHSRCGSEGRTSVLASHFLRNAATFSATPPSSPQRRHLLRSAAVPAAKADCHSCENRPPMRDADSSSNPRAPVAGQRPALRRTAFARAHGKSDPHPIIEPNPA